ncbi:hypothetical protein QE152_g34488 [Popillia japonica]|uniref:Uncharacterized protein n=1 Tax=Popillia japonica TaxID=7064 RepID=A0AAW1ISV4_POPJA
MPIKLIIGKPILENVTLIMNSEGIKVVPKREETVTKNIDEANDLPDLFLIDRGNNLDIGKSEYLSKIETMENENIVLKETLSKARHKLAEATTQINKFSKERRVIKSN